MHNVNYVEGISSHSAGGKTGVKHCKKKHRHMDTSQFDGRHGRSHLFRVLVARLARGEVILDTLKAAERCWAQSK